MSIRELLAATCIYCLQPSETLTHVATPEREGVSHRVFACPLCVAVYSNPLDRGEEYARFQLPLRNLDRLLSGEQGDAPAA